MRLLVDCSYVYDNPHINSGIQRVVRNIISKLDRSREIANAIPIIFRNKNIYEVKRLSPGNSTISIANRFHSKLIRERKKFWHFYDQTEQVYPFSVRPRVREWLFSFLKIGDKFFYLAIMALSRICRKGEIGNRIVDLKVKQDDILVLLDCSWYSDALPYIEELKRQGIPIVAVIYDLIPLTHSRLCNDDVVTVFQRWFKWVMQLTDGFMTISRTVADQLKDYTTQTLSQGQPQGQWFDYFHLGSELDLVKSNDSIRCKVAKPFDNGRPVYLMVGTIEPRKNHAYLLDAFDLLWQRGMCVNLCFVGSVGWKCQALIKRVKNHKEYNQRLFMFNDLSDAELEYCYSRSRSLVFPAFVEGFGLPLVEAMQRGLPAMASDIPVFREIGGDFIAYFDLNEPQSLVTLVQRFERDGEFPALRKVQEWSWMSWEDSTRQFLTKITVHLAKSRGATRGSSQNEK
jgi:alpha-1,2-rhamnosyltransferase